MQQETKESIEWAISDLERGVSRSGAYEAKHEYPQAYGYISSAAMSAIRELRFALDHEKAASVRNAPTGERRASGLEGS